MIEVSSLTHLAQSQTVAPVETPRTVQPITPVQSSEKIRDESTQLANANTVVSRDTSLKFRIDQDSERLVVSLLDSDGTLIRQMPSELILRLAQRIEEIQEQGKFGIDTLA